MGVSNINVCVCVCVCASVIYVCVQKRGNDVRKDKDKSDHHYVAAPLA